MQLHDSDFSVTQLLRDIQASDTQTDRTALNLGISVLSTNKEVGADSVF